MELTNSSPGSQAFDADASILHLSAIAFETDWPRGGYFQLTFEGFTVADGVRNAVLDRDDQLVPILRLIPLQVRERSGQCVIAALQLRTAAVDATVSIRRRAKFELQNEIVSELPRRPQLLNLAAFGRRGDDETAVDHDEPPIRRCGLAVEVNAFGDKRPRCRVEICGLPSPCTLLVGVRCRPVPPPGQIAPIEEALEAILRCEWSRRRLGDLQRREQRVERRGPLGITDTIWMQQVGKLARLCVAIDVGKECPGVEGD